MTETWNGSPVHSIIERPHEYEIIRLDYHNRLENPRDSFLDLTLRWQSIVRRLRFIRPQRLVIEEGFPAPTHGMVILDIRDRQWDGLRVEVADFEASPGSISFCAADVVDLDSTSL